MALIPPAFLNTVVALGNPSQDGNTSYNATGFIYGYHTGNSDEEGKKLYRLFLVTNRHVFQRAYEHGKVLHARFNKLMESGSNTYTVNFEDANWIVHPNPEADVAVMPVNSNRLRADGIEFQCFQGNDHVLTLEQARESEISEGDGIFVLGFPLGQAGEERNYAIVRQGIIARAQDWLKGNSQTFLIDASIFPGNSGGPVLTKPDSIAIQGTKANHRCGLIGMVSSYLPYQEVAVSQQTGRPRMIFEENSGLGVVVPHDVIQEAVLAAVQELIPAPQTNSGPEVN